MVAPGVLGLGRGRYFSHRGHVGSRAEARALAWVGRGLASCQSSDLLQWAGQPQEDMVEMPG